jgi:hypothetical protein
MNSTHMSSYRRNSQRMPCGWQGQSGLEPSVEIRRCCLSAPTLVEQLALEQVLKEHHGCVNCLSWNADGRYARNSVSFIGNVFRQLG